MFILIRRTGEYESRQETPIAAFHSEVEAQKSKEGLDAWFARRPSIDFDRMTDDCGDLKPYWKGRLLCPFDRDFFESSSWMEEPDYSVMHIPNFEFASDFLQPRRKGEQL